MEKAQGELIVVALGGNAFQRSDEKRTFASQFERAHEASIILADLIEAGHRLVITHGNGPQIGDTLLRHDAGQRMYNVSALPMDVCVAETQGSIGYIIQQTLRSELKRRKHGNIVLTILTRVFVDKEDEELKKPTKPIGPFYPDSEINEIRKRNPANTYSYDEARKGWRRLVVSPDPMRIGIAEQLGITLLLNSGCTVIACGGGGIPIIEEGGWKAQGIEGVIDKDLAAERLATLIRADKLVILTDIDSVYLDFGKQNQRKIERISASEASKLISKGQFTKGSMEPKVLAGVRFVHNGGKCAIIAELSKAIEAIAGNSGTAIVPDIAPQEQTLK